MSLLPLHLLTDVGHCGSGQSMRCFNLARKFLSHHEHHSEASFQCVTKITCRLFLSGGSASLLDLFTGEIMVIMPKIGIAELRKQSRYEWQLLKIVCSNLSKYRIKILNCAIILKKNFYTIHSAIMKLNGVVLKGTYCLNLVPLLLAADDMITIVFWIQNFRTVRVWFQVQIQTIVENKIKRNLTCY